MSDGISTGKTTLVKHDIDTGDAEPVAGVMYRRSPMAHDLIEQEVQKNLKAGIIEPSNTPWAAPVVLQKKPDGKNLGGCDWYTGIDLKSGYWQVGMADAAKERSAVEKVFTLLSDATAVSSLLTTAGKSRLGGHRGEAKMVLAISQKYWWPDLWADVSNWVKHCEVCQQFSRYRPAYTPKSIYAQYPGDYVAIDFFFPTAKSPEISEDESIEGYRDTYSFASYLKEWIRYQGCPKHLLSDRDPSFISELNEKFYQAWGMNKITVTAYQPQSNGAVENAVQSVKIVMSKYIIKNPETWKQNLHWVELDINTKIRKIVKVQQEKEKRRQQEEMKRRLKQKRDNLEIGTRVWMKLTRELDLGTVGNQYEIFHLDKLKPYYESSQLQKQAKHPQGIEAPRIQKEPIMERVSIIEGTYYLVKLRHEKAKDARWYEEKYIPPAALMTSWRTRQSYEQQQSEKRSAREAPHYEDPTANRPEVLASDTGKKRRGRPPKPILPFIPDQSQQPQQEKIPSSTVETRTTVIKGHNYGTKI
ncbi:Transposon Ty3-I Gag-Pol polyprotein [Pelomyxa schiedti]|nr:Transposon Ty3-I Gag-Pol polyprotein [Pelomyxa schiedti]